MELEGVGFHDLPEGCIANVLSFTTPRDACMLSLVSRTFRSAVESDSVWVKFLPSDYRNIISQSSPATSFSSFNTKELYLYLCENPILIEEGKKSFQLDKECGKKCYMLSSRNLLIVWGDTPRYWRWTSLPQARFSEVAELVSVCWLEIRGRINTSMLSPETVYGAYLVFKQSPAGSFGFEYQSVEVSIGIAGGDTRKQTVFLYVPSDVRPRYNAPRRIGVFRHVVPYEPHPQAPAAPENGELQCPKQREDGWLEMEIGDYFNQGGDDMELEMGVYEIKGGYWKGGLLVQGIEIRPKPCP